jgi:hypothetical protein
MTVWRARFSVELSGPVVGRSRSLSAVVILRFPVCSPSSPVRLSYRWKAVVFLRQGCFSRSNRHDRRKKNIQSP